MYQIEMPLDLAREALARADKATGETEMERSALDFSDLEAFEDDILARTISEEREKLRQDIEALEQAAWTISKRKIVLRKLMFMLSGLKEGATFAA